MKVKIRPVRAVDKAAIMRILNILPEFRPFEVVVAEEVLDACLKDGTASGYYTLVAEDSEGVVGYVCYGPTPCTQDTWDIYWLAVTPEKQGNGTGGKLMDTAEADISRQNGRLMVIETSSQPLYEKTRRFHARIGYQLAATVAGFYAPGDDKLILVKQTS